tara:strand:- start:15 stop:1217 length:1203 start_codon:yes stop_codon:yes gene_type:complete
MKLWFCIGWAFIAFAGCSQFNAVTLYSNDTSEVHPLDYFDQAIIFHDSQASIVTGLRNTTCKEVRFEQGNSFGGEDHMSIEWDASRGCKFIGIQIPWASYAAKDLTPLLDCAAIEMAIRLEEGSLTNIPMFFGLVDYAGRQCMTKINFLGMDDGVLDTSWRKVRIPLHAFNYERRGVNMANIKELKIEFQRSGHAHIDEIKIVRYEHHYSIEPDHSTEVVAGLPLKIGSTPEEWWGINPRYSSSFLFGEEQNVGGFNEANPMKIQADVNTALPDAWDQFGVSFSNWKRVDLASLHTTAALSFDLVCAEMPDLVISIHAFSGQRRQVRTQLQSHQLVARGENQFQAYIPIRSFPDYESLDWSALKEVRFRVEESARFDFANLRLIEFRGNPQNPVAWKGYE